MGVIRVFRFQSCNLIYLLLTLLFSIGGRVRESCISLLLCGVFMRGDVFTGTSLPNQSFVPIEFSKYVVDRPGIVFVKPRVQLTMSRDFLVYV